MKKILKNKNFMIFMLSLITTISISIKVVNSSFVFDGNNFIWIFIFGILCVFFNKAIEAINKRLLICSRSLRIYNCNFNIDITNGRSK